MILVDLNVVLDVVQYRQPHYQASASILDQVVQDLEIGVVSAHAVTTLHYLMGRYRDRTQADKLVDWLLRYFDIATVGVSELRRARALNWPDFEDAVVAAAAENHGCIAIVTRNLPDFENSPVPALTPEEWLSHRS